MEYKVKIERAEFYAYHGCYDLEQRVGNRFEVDLELSCHLEPNTQDDVTQMVSYLDAYNTLREQMARTQRTIEVVALNIIEALKAGDSRIKGVKCKVSKLSPPLGGKVERASVEFEI
ncbi:MAG: dihydroneopterin aldolase [Rikenellaceae bacterium]